MFTTVPHHQVMSDAFSATCGYAARSYTARRKKMKSGETIVRKTNNN